MSLGMYVLIAAILIVVIFVSQITLALSRSTIILWGCIAVTALSSIGLLVTIVSFIIQLVGGL